MPYKCFFSYARDNADEYLETFFNDLREEIHQYTSLPPPEILFRDTRLETGDNWDERLKAGLATSDALICLVSPTYVGREFCGKEFQIFTETTTISTANFMRYIIYHGYDHDGDIIAVNLTPQIALAGNPTQLVDSLNLLLMANGMSSQMRTILINTISPPNMSNPTNRTKAALRLIVTSPEYLVQR